MKKIILIAVLFVGSMFAPQTADAQIDIRVNIGLQPIWGPAGFEYVEYYYIPEIDVYYHVPSRQYVYFYKGRWIARKRLPSRYRHFDFFRSRIIVVNEPSPFYNHTYIRNKYIHFWNTRNYITIRDSRNPKYYANRDHPRHNEYDRYYNGRNDRYNDRNNDRYSDHNNDRDRYNGRRNDAIYDAETPWNSRNQNVKRETGQRDNVKRTQDVKHTKVERRTQDVKRTQNSRQPQNVKRSQTAKPQTAQTSNSRSKSSRSSSTRRETRR